MTIFKGAGVAIVTPMYDNEEVNYDKLEELINWQIDQGTDAIVITGTTGESSTLSMEEHRKVIKAAVDFTKHRVPVVAGTGSNCTRTAIQHAVEAEEGRLEQIENAFDKRVARALNRVGMPSRNDLDALSVRLEQLSALVEQAAKQKN